MLRRVFAVMLVLFVLCSCSGNSHISNSNNNSATVSGNSTNNDSASSKDAVKEQVELLFTTYKSARQIYSVDVSELKPETVVFLRQLQGLVAKNDSASIYLVSNDADKHWLNYICNELGAYSTETTVEQLVGMYKDYIETLVVYSSDDNEFSFAWNEAMRRSNAICLDYKVANDFELFENRESISVRGVFTDAKASYEAHFSMIDIDKSNRVFVSISEQSEFIDYAYACGAYMLPLCTDEWSSEFVRTQLSLCENDKFGVVYSDSEVGQDDLSLYSTYGFGNVSVGGFSNSTTLSSIKIDYKFEKPKINGSIKNGNTYVSLIIDCESAGDIINNSYAICNSKKNKYSFAYEYPMFMSKIAPATLLWFSVNSTQKGDSLVSDGGWLKIDMNALSDDLYQLWHDVNNYFLIQCGIGVVSASGDIDSEYKSYVLADGILNHTNYSHDGEYTYDNKPVLYVQKFNDLIELESALNNLAFNSERPLFYLFSLSAAKYFDKMPIYDIQNGYYGVGTPDGYYTITEVLAMFTSNNKSAKFVSPNQLVNYFKKN